MTRVCAWCSKNMGTVDSGIHSEAVITHGVCRDCVNKFFGVEVFAERGVGLEVFLDSLAAPVVVVDSTVTVKTANRQARVLLQKDLPAIEGYQGGNVFECAHARLPGGCGNTIHCSGCAVRGTVTDTFQSGRSHLKVPAYLKSGTPDDCQEVHLLISTEKVGEVVLLRIDEVGANEAAHP